MRLTGKLLLTLLSDRTVLHVILIKIPLNIYFLFHGRMDYDVL